MNDLIGFVLSASYVSLVLFLGKVLHRKGILSPKGLRKWIHLLVGGWILPCIYLFEHWYWAALLPFAFVWINLFGWRYFPVSFDAQERYGPVYFPISFVILISLFWDWPLRWIVCSALLLMAWADWAACFVGERWGRHPYRFFGTEKSVEGSLAMLGASFLTCLLVFGLLARFPISTTLFVGLAVSLVATAAEAVSGRGLDNITVPLLSALTAYLILFGPGS